ncbi:sigma 54-interacting transcriptional regulator [Sporolactobacillus sp. CPB3-1]|uniref:Sigma 54-interacting transcriptional regulator n=1 Tax=Sporolactobacillus mangiferae TaxID=2940498 RepID=A0ABT0M9B6_9BACL|nr:sigma 54-interacting transcriptional regulator [Sporolactobacillus mangiferae]
MVSHYLSGLLKEGLVLKKGRKPVRWSAVQNIIHEPEERKTDAFHAFIGFDGSQEAVIEQCKASVNYPPDGLPLIINGESGVGKSFLASLIYHYAVDNGVIAPHAPFIILNCADYANNPELLSSTLFGYRKGAFTGADQDKAGLLQQADGGYLFFDEIHRLSFENQEKLFIFMDKGQFRPIGENKQWQKSKVRLIFATTEQNDEVLLGTFRRRIPAKVHLCGLSERPFFERFQLIYCFYLQESKKIQRNIEISSEVFSQLCFHKFEGNVGMLRNMIQLSCAHAFSTQQNQEWIKIDLNHLPAVMQKRAESSGYRKLPPIRISMDDSAGETVISPAPHQLTHEIIDFFTHLSRDRKDGKALDRSALILQFKKLAQQMHQASQDNARFINQSSLIYEEFKTEVFRIKERYGIMCSADIIDALFEAYMICLRSRWQTDIISSLDDCVIRIFPKAHYVAEKLVIRLEHLIDKNISGLLTQLFTFFIQPFIAENIQLHGLMVAHGSHTASSIQTVVNQLCQTFVFESIDMPFDTGINEIIEKVKDYLHRQDTSDGLILLVDMGSLTHLYSSIKNQLAGDLLVINNLTTAVALDVGMKMVQNVPFKVIAEQAKDGYAVEARYFEGLTQGKNIIISCMSGAGISNRVREIMTRFIPQDRLDVLTMDYKELRDAVLRNDETYFIKTLLIITTSELPAKLDVPSVNIYKILENKGREYLWQELQPFLSRAHFESMIQQLLKDLTIEGVSSRLNFLNPSIIINEVEYVISLYEKYYEMKVDGKGKLNLYMHIALMVERLITTKSNHAKEHLDLPTSDEEQEFNAVTKEIFHDMEAKYNIHVNGYERTLLYELLRQFIKRNNE